MSFTDILQKERDIWHRRFVPSVVAAAAVLIITIILQQNSFDIVLLSSISASFVILTAKNTHRLTVLGTAIYSYLLATVVGLFFAAIHSMFNISTAVTSFLTIATISLVIYMANVVHPPAIGIAIGIVLYQGTAFNLFIVLLVTFLMFIIIKVLMYLYYKHLTFRRFHHEFLIWEKKFFE